MDQVPGWLAVALLGTVVFVPLRHAGAAEPREAPPEAELLLNLDLLREADLARERDLLRRMQIVERWRLLESLRLLESRAPLESTKQKEK